MAANEVKGLMLHAHSAFGPGRFQPNDCGSHDEADAVLMHSMMALAERVAFGKPAQTTNFTKRTKPSSLGSWNS